MINLIDIKTRRIKNSVEQHTMATNFIGIILALTSAAVWGSGDFSGGVAARKSSHYQVLWLVSLAGMVLLLICAFIWGEGLPSPKSAFWGVMAGASGALGMAPLYRALSMGNIASVAPTSGIICAALPVLVGIIIEGYPGVTQLAGFGLAMGGIWLVSQSPNAVEKSFKQGMTQAFLSGIGFGGYFVFLAQVDKGQVFGPIFIGRTVTLIVAMLLLRLNHIPLPGLLSNPIALVAGVLDTGGNVFYLLATQFTRLDIAAVLSALYPAMTVLLAVVILKEKVTKAQWAGGTLCLLAIIMITL